MRRQLLAAGIPDEQIPTDWLQYIVAATRQWTGTTRDGAADAAQLLGLRMERGATDKNYYAVDHEEVVEITASGDDVWLVQGAILQGEVIDPRNLRVSEKSREPCDGCGMIGSCLKTVRDPSTDQIQFLCNFCCTYHESPHIKDLGGMDNCESCSVLTCAHHPRRMSGRGINGLR